MHPRCILVDEDATDGDATDEDAMEEDATDAHRVAKCHGYRGYIRVKKLEDWGKKSGRTHSFAKSSIVLGKFEQHI